MGLLSRKPRTRAEIIAAADHARARGRVQKAVAGYRKALESNPADASIHVKLAPLLARLGDVEGGAESFRIAARKHAESGFTDRAAAVNVQAAAVFPLHADFRLELARLNVARGRRQDAVQALLDGGRKQARARRPQVAVSLFRKALEIEPWHFDTVLALAPALVRTGHDEAARSFIDGLLQRERGKSARRVRWVAFRLWPGLGTFWRWIRG